MFGPALILLFGLIVVAMLYGQAIKRGLFGIGTLLMLILIAGFVGGGIIAAYAFTGLGGFLGCLMWFPLGLIGIGIYRWIVMKQPDEKLKISPKQALWLRIGLFALWMITLAPVTSATVYTGFCHNRIEETGRPIVLAVRQYYEATGRYPETLEALIPTYLDAIPEIPCVETFGDYHVGTVMPYQMRFCIENQPIIEVSSMDDAFPYRYDFSTDKWSTISFLDGTCAFLGK